MPEGGGRISRAAGRSLTVKEAAWGLERGQHDQVVIIRALHLRSGGRGFTFRFDHFAGVISRYMHPRSTPCGHAFK